MKIKLPFPKYNPDSYIWHEKLCNGTAGQQDHVLDAVRIQSPVPYYTSAYNNQTIAYGWAEAY